jgi:hypothetical protein
MQREQKITLGEYGRPAALAGYWFIAATIVARILSS